MKIWLGSICAGALALELFPPNAMGQAFILEPALAPSYADAAIPLYPAKQLDQMFSPIALFPDPLIDQILSASQYPLDIIKAYRWLQNPENAALTGNTLYAALANENWNPSVKALVSIPEVLGMLNDHIDWTEALGKAYRYQQNDVMASVQSLRDMAYEAGNLTTTPKQTVSMDNGEIYIEPANPNIVYVPAYNPSLVYGYWPYADFPPYYFTNYTCASPVIFFGAGYRISRYSRNEHRHHEPSPAAHNRKAEQPHNRREPRGNHEVNEIKRPHSQAIPPRSQQTVALHHNRNQAASQTNKQSFITTMPGRQYAHNNRPSSSQGDTIKLMNPLKSAGAITRSAEPRRVLHVPNALPSPQNITVGQERTYTTKHFSNAARVNRPPQVSRENAPSERRYGHENRHEHEYNYRGE